jgi:hypothetical protein
MAKFINFPVASVVQHFSADNILNVAPATATTTTIKYAGGSGPVTATLTHTSSTAVAAAVMDAVLKVNAPKSSPDVRKAVVLPTGITVSAVAIA